MWKRRQWLVADAAALGSGQLVGVATVLIPNPDFGRDIPPVWWSYPVCNKPGRLRGQVECPVLAA